MSNTSIRTKAATDNTAPKPINSNISNHQQGVPIDTKLSITFDEDIKLGKGFFVISNGLNDTRYMATSDSSAVTIKGNTLTLDPGKTLLSNSPYFVQMSAGAVTDTSGNAVAAIMDTSVLTFTTAVDQTPPIYLRTYPEHHAEQVDIKTGIASYFTETIKAGTGTITISNGHGDTRSIAVNDISQVKIDGGRIAIDPTQDLLNNSEYYVLVDKGAIVDIAGNAYAGTQDPTAFTFKTTSSDTTAPILSDLKSGSLTLRFNETVKAGSGAITFADSQGNKQSIAIHDTSQVSISTYSHEVTLRPTVPLIAGAEYVVEMDSGVLTDRSGNAFAGTQGTLHYTVPIPTPPTPPIPIRSTPADDKTHVEVNSAISLTFNEYVNLSTGHFIISNGQGDTRIIAGNDNSQVRMDTHSLGNGKGTYTDYTTVIINPKEDLLAGSQYFVQMEAGAVKDFDGTPVVSVMDTTALNFTTVDKDTTAPIYLSSDNALQVIVNSFIAGKFNEPIKAGSGNFIVSNGLGDTRTIAANDTTQVSIDSSKIYIDPSKDLLWNSTYTLTAENNAIADMQGNSFAGGVLHFTTVSDHEAPLRLSSDSFVAVKGDNISLNFNEPIKVGIGKLLLNNGLGDIRTIDMNDPS
ncbi:MAG: Ig-like domain-containing protein [Methylococcales bacterium]|nr:Ig-like domain-containing protein [Methylococcales bacterium]